MKTLREKVTFILTALFYLLCHLRLGPNLETVTVGTLYQMLLTMPYALGGTLVAQLVLAKLGGVRILPWDRLLRIFFTVGICFAFFLGLYEHGTKYQPDTEGLDAQPRILRYLEGEGQSAP